MTSLQFSGCKCCGFHPLKKLISFENQPISTQYRVTLDEEYKTYTLSLATCEHCGILQLCDYIPENKLLTPPPWISYNEPEGHLDDTTRELAPYIEDKKSKIRGLSYKDLSTIERLNKIGFEMGALLDFNFAEKFDAPLNIELVQNLVTPKNCALLNAREERADVLLVRHVLEHTFDTKNFLAGIKSLVKPNGVVLFEIPDCSKQIENFDYTCLWEDHTLYLVPETFRWVLTRHGFTVKKLLNFEYSTENALVAICKLDEENPSVNQKYEAVTDQYYSALIKKFVDNFENIKTKIQDFILNKRKSGKVTIFGAGHLSGTFIHIFEIEKLIDFVVDDDPNKVGKYMPGSKIQIKPSSALAREKIKTCLLSLSPESEQKLLRNSQTLFQNIETIKSIFPKKENSIF